MPTVVTTRSFGAAPPAELWAVLRCFDRYPQFMEHVISVDILSEGVGVKESAWVVLFNGNELRWTERDEIDDAAQEVRFEQIDGDLALWRGVLQVHGGRETIATYTVEFDLGVPALSSLLNPLGERAVRVNCDQILEAAAGQVEELA